MQIDSRNRYNATPIILQLIPKASFISFDCEFTGLVTLTQHIQGLYPDYQQFYERIKETALNFNLLQFGITIFIYQNQRYTPHTFNFYVQSIRRDRYNQIIIAEWESLSFLSRNRMDFNRAFQFGCPFGRISQLETYRNLNPLQRQQPQYEYFFGKQDQEIVTKITTQLAQPKIIIVDFVKENIFKYFKDKMNDCLFQKSKQCVGKWEFICKRQMSQAWKQANYTQKDAQMDYEAPCIQKVIQSIITHRTPLVGHFPNLDLGLIYHAFIDELPPTFEEFTHNLNNYFPYIFDTKVISRRVQNRVKSIKVDLKSLFRCCRDQKGVFAEFANINYKNSQQYIKAQNCHDAGYDSFITGCSFITMLNFIYGIKKQQFDFSKAVAQNRILYSKFTGEVSLIAPFTKNTEIFSRKIVIHPKPIKDFDMKLLAQQLTGFGSFRVTEDHQETYLQFNSEADINAILSKCQQLKPYSKRKIIKSRNMFS